MRPEEIESSRKLAALYYPLALMHAASTLKERRTNEYIDEFESSPPDKVF